MELVVEWFGQILYGWSSTSKRVKQKSGTA